MAISNLVTPGKKMDLPSVSMFFGARSAGAANDNMQKVSSTMMSDSMVSAITGALKTFTSEIAKFQETSRGAVRSFINIIKSLKELNKDITFKFKALGTELNASRLEFVRNVLADKVPVVATTTEIKDPERQQREEIKEKKEDDNRFSFIDALADLLGIRSLSKAGGAALRGGANLLRGFGAVISNPIVAGMLVAGTSFAAALFGSAAIGDWLEKKFGIKEKIAAREKTEEYQELRKTQEDAAKAARNKNDPERRKTTQENLGEFKKKYNLSNNDFRKDPPGGDIVVITKEGHPNKGLRFNVVTGQEIAAPAVRTQTPTAPTGESVRAAPDTGSSAATGAGGGGEDLNRVTDTVPATGGGGSAPAGTPTREGATGTSPAAPGGGGGAPAPAPAAPAAAPAGGGAGAPQRNSSPGGGGEPLNTATAQHWMLNHPDVTAAYAALNSADKQKAAEMASTGKESEARNFVLSRGSVPKTLPAQMLTGGAQTVRGLEPSAAPSTPTPVPTAPPPPAATPAADKRASNEPVVINNNSSQSTAMTDGGEGNNIAGQNFAMFVTDPFLTEFLQKQNVPYA